MPDLLDYRSYPRGDEPACFVLVDGVWREGYIRAWYRYPDGWRANVEYRAPVTVNGGSFTGNHLATFEAGDVREVEQ